MNQRRRFLKLTVAAGAGAALTNFPLPLAAQSGEPKVRVTLIRWPYT